MKYKNYYHTFSIGDCLLSNIEYEYKKRNFYDTRLLLRWNEIIGKLAEKMSPIKIVFSGIENNIIQKTLYCITQDRMFATEFTFYKNDILDKLNFYFGNEKTIFKDIKLKVSNELE